jgi:hypothetical protein
MQVAGSKCLHVLKARGLPATKRVLGKPKCVARGLWRGLAATFKGFLLSFSLWVRVLHLFVLSLYIAQNALLAGSYC